MNEQHRRNRYWQLKLVLKVLIDQYNHRLTAPLGSVLAATAVFWLLEPSEVMTPVAKHREVSAKAGVLYHGAGVS